MSYLAIKACSRRLHDIICGLYDTIIYYVIIDLNHPNILKIQSIKNVDSFKVLVHLIGLVLVSEIEIGSPLERPSDLSETY